MPNKTPTDAELHNARAAFRELLSRSTPERTWQGFFAANPFVLSRSLPLRLEPSDILPLGRPGVSEPDFLIYPGSSSSAPCHGLIELKTNSARIATIVRKNVLTLTRNAATALQQIRNFDQSYDCFSPVKRCLSFGSHSYLFIVMGRQDELTDLCRLPNLAPKVNELFPPDVRLLTFDELFQQYEAGLPERSFVLLSDAFLSDRAAIGARQAAIDALDREAPFHLRTDVCRYIDGLLGDAEPAQLCGLVQKLRGNGFKLYATRKLESAKEYVRTRFATAPQARYGLIASSQDTLLPQFDLNIRRQTVRPSEDASWFLADPTDSRSGCQMARAATEYALQGLELDYALVAWGSDLRRVSARWSEVRSSGCQRPAANGLTRRRLAYRILLTRGRRGSVTFVPPPAELDETWAYLLDSGFHALRA